MLKTRLGMKPHGEDETDVDGHYWHSPKYVAAWIRDFETDAAAARRAVQENELARICAALDRGRRRPRLLRLLRQLPDRRLPPHGHERSKLHYD